MIFVMYKPKPVEFLSFFVEKYGSNIFSITSSAIPPALSFMVIVAVSSVELSFTCIDFLSTLFSTRASLALERIFTMKLVVLMKGLLLLVEVWQI